MHSNTNSNTQDKKDPVSTLLAACKQEQNALFKHSRSWVLAPTHTDLTPEELEKAKLIEDIRYYFQFAIHEIFRHIHGDVRSPIYLVCLPHMLALDSRFFGLNAVLRTIISDEATKERKEIAIAFDEQLKVDYLYTLSKPSFERLADALARLSNTPVFTLGECYWLLELCQWLKCIKVLFSETVKDVISSEDISVIDFTKQLDTVNPKHRMLANAALSQYKELVILLRKMS